MKGFFWSVAAGITVVFVTRYISSRSHPEPTDSAMVAANQEFESETYA